MKTAASIVGIVVAAALGGCAHQPTTSAQAPSPQEEQKAAVACNFQQIPGVHASVEDIRNGVAITFTGPHSEVDQLRTAVHAMNDANSDHNDAFAACPCAAGNFAQGAAEAMPEQSSAGQEGPQRGGLVPADTSVDNIPTGAVLKFTAKDKAQLQALRQQVRSNVRALRQGCMSPQGGVAPNVGPQRPSPGAPPPY